MAQLWAAHTKHNAAQLLGGGHFLTSTDGKPETYPHETMVTTQRVGEATKRGLAFLDQRRDEQALMAFSEAAQQERLADPPPTGDDAESGATFTHMAVENGPLVNTVEQVGRLHPTYRIAT